MEPETETKLNILVADQSDDVRSLLENSLKATGHEVTLAADGATAKRLIALRHFDVAIVDGHEVDVILAFTQQQPTGRIIVMKGGGEHINGDHGLTSSLRLGVHGLILKPFTADQLIEVLKGVLVAR
jgi:DNA-binding NtrC family response regulator